VIISQPTPARVLIEEDVWALQTLSHLLTYYGKMEHGDPVHFNNITKAAFLNLAKTLEERVKECTIDYDGVKYIIMAKGRRRLMLGFKREPDLYIGSDYGTNFIEACKGYFMLHYNSDKFNEKNLTYYGRSLFGIKANDISDIDIGINKTGSGYYSIWFSLFNQTYNLTPQEKGDAELQRKLLTRTFENLMAIKKTMPQ
jgi:hypothetical protein